MTRLPAIALALALLAVAACDGAPEARRDGPALQLVLEEAGPTGARLRIHDGDTQPPRDVASGFAWAASCAVHHDGATVCFLARGQASGTAALYVARPGAEGPERVDVPVDESAAPAWLPDGRIVYSAVTPDGARALFVTATTQARPERITFGLTPCRDPTVLPDGRVLYAGSTLGAGAARAPALFTVHPDGTGVALFHAATTGARYGRPRAAADGRVGFLVHGAGRTTGVLLDPRAPAEPGAALSLPAGIAAVEPLRDGTWLVLGPEGAERVDGAGARLAAATLPTGTGDVAGVVELGPRPRPQGHMSMVDPKRATGQVLCIDARPEGSPDVAASVRVFARRARGKGGAAWEALGTVPTAPDGSFFVTVPADTPLRIEVEDGGGHVTGSRTPFWVRRGEMRGCIGCHDAPDATPPNRRPQAALQDPIPLPAGKRKRSP